MHDGTWGRPPLPIFNGLVFEKVEPCLCAESALQDIYSPSQNECNVIKGPEEMNRIFIPVKAAVTQVQETTN